MFLLFYLIHSSVKLKFTKKLQLNLDLSFGSALLSISNLIFKPVLLFFKLKIRSILLNNQRLVSNIIFRKTIKSNKAFKQYFGSTGKRFKQKYTNHKYSFGNVNKRHTTELAIYVSNLKDNNTVYKIDIEILNRTKPKPNTKVYCSL